MAPEVERVKRLILSNYGHRLITHALALRSQEAIVRDPGLALLLDIKARSCLPFDPEAHRGLVAGGLAEAIDTDLSAEGVRLRYRVNPLRHVTRLILECTNLCNLNCRHCRNGHLAPATETRINLLKDAVDAAAQIGIRRFDFMGGEVTLFANGWLDVAERAAGYPATTVAVMSSGWFFGERGFWAAGERYADDAEYLAALKQRGVTHVILSVDGPEEQHDLWRGLQGLYRRVMAGFDKVRRAGLQPAVSLLNPTGHGSGDSLDWLAQVSEGLYGDSPGRAVARLLSDEMNYVSNLIDLGNAVSLRISLLPFELISDQELVCKQLYRPVQGIGIKASGELSLCPLVDAGDGYGNIREHGLVPLLNRMQDSPTYKLHAERRLGEYRRFLDERIFGDCFDNVCTPRALVTMVARGMIERGIEPDDDRRIRALNLEVAERSGFRPTQRQRPTGQHGRRAIHRTASAPMHRSGQGRARARG